MTLAPAPDEILNDVVFIAEDEWERQLEEWRRRRGVLGEDADETAYAWDPTLHPRFPRGTKEGGRFRSKFAGLFKSPFSRESNLALDQPLKKGDVYFDPQSSRQKELRPTSAGPFEKGEHIIITKKAKGRIYFGPFTPGEPAHATQWLPEEEFRMRMRPAALAEEQPSEPSPKLPRPGVRKEEERVRTRDVLTGHGARNREYVEQLEEFYNDAGLDVSLPASAVRIPLRTRSALIDGQPALGGVHYSFPGDGRPELMRVDPKAPGFDAKSTLGHEMAHYWDKEVFGIDVDIDAFIEVFGEPPPEIRRQLRDVKTVRMGGSDAIAIATQTPVPYYYEDKYGLENVMEALRLSHQFQARGNLEDQLGIEIMLSIREGDFDHADEVRQALQYASYLDEPPEMFARAVQQYLQMKAGHDVDHIHQFRTQETPDCMIPLYWDDDDFEPIQQALEDMFAKLGWTESTVPSEEELKGYTLQQLREIVRQGGPENRLHWNERQKAAWKEMVRRDDERGQ